MRINSISGMEACYGSSLESVRRNNGTMDKTFGTTSDFPENHTSLVARKMSLYNILLYWDIFLATRLQCRKSVFKLTQNVAHCPWFMIDRSAPKKKGGFLLTRTLGHSVSIVREPSHSRKRVVFAACVVTVV